MTVRDCYVVLLLLCNVFFASVKAWERIPCSVYRRQDAFPFTEFVDTVYCNPAFEKCCDGGCCKVDPEPRKAHKTPVYVYVIFGVLGVAAILIICFKCLCGEQTRFETVPTNVTTRQYQNNEEVVNTFSDTPRSRPNPSAPPEISRLAPLTPPPSYEDAVSRKNT